MSQHTDSGTLPEIGAPEGFTHSFATAADGAKLSYYTTTSSGGGGGGGGGPSVLILHGANSYALTHRDLAALLAAQGGFNVHTASRRQRGLSSDYPAEVLALP